MVSEIPAIDIEAFEALDHRRLLRVLGRAIDEEAAECMNRDHFFSSYARDRTRLRFFCTLVSMIEDMNDSGLDGTPGFSGRRRQRTL
jgi:hypothetical protein